LHALVKGLFVGTVHNDWRPGPVIDPIRDIGPWFYGANAAYLP